MQHGYSRLSLLALAALSMATASAQFVQVLNEEGEMVNGHTLYVSGDVTSEVDLGIGLNTVSTTDQFVHMRRYEMGVLPGTANYFCWDLCWLPADAGTYPTWMANSAQYLTANTPYTGFHAYYDPNGIAGESVFRFVWFSPSNDDDSTYVDIVFNAGTVGISESGSAVRSFSAFPNPANNSDVTLTYDLASAPAGAKLVVYNMLGERTLSRTLGTAQGRVTLRTGELPAGVFFATLESNGKALATRRVVVTR